MSPYFPHTMHTYTHTYTCSFGHTHTHTHTQKMGVCTNTQRKTDVHKRTCAHQKRFTQTDTHTHTHTHAHTHWLNLQHRSGSVAAPHLRAHPQAELGQRCSRTMDPTNYPGVQGEPQPPGGHVQGHVRCRTPMEPGCTCKQEAWLAHVRTWHPGGPVGSRGLRQP